MATFFTQRAHDEWSAALAAAERPRWSTKYYKGLGTSTAAEAREYFGDLRQHRIQFGWDSSRDGDLIDMAFSKTRVLLAGRP